MPSYSKMAAKDDRRKSPPKEPAPTGKTAPNGNAIAAVGATGGCPGEGTECARRALQVHRRKPQRPPRTRSWRRASRRGRPTAHGSRGRSATASDAGSSERILLRPTPRERMRKLPPLKRSRRQRPKRQRTGAGAPLKGKDIPNLTPRTGRRGRKSPSRRSPTTEASSGTIVRDAAQVDIDRARRNLLEALEQAKDLEAAYCERLGDEPRGSDASSSGHLRDEDGRDEPRRSSCRRSRRRLREREALRGRSRRPQVSAKETSATLQAEGLTPAGALLRFRVGLK